MATPTATRPGLAANAENSFEIAWINFINSLKILMMPIPEDRGMDQYLSFRDEVMRYVLSEKFLFEMKQYWSKHYRDNREAFDLLLMEMRPFPHAVEVTMMEANAEQAEEKDEKKKGFRNWRIWKWLNRGGTVAGSVKDLFKGLPDYARNGLTILKEVIDLFKGKG